MNKVKRACLYYLNSWWLPPVVVVIWTNLWPILPTNKTVLPSDSDGPTILLVGPAPYIAWLGWFIFLGLLGSLVWLLFHKHWRKALWSFSILVLLQLFLILAGIFFPNILQKFLP
jgi:hypothetical protein